MAKSIFLPLLLQSVCVLLLCLLIPCMSSADQVELIPESSQQSGDSSVNMGADPLTSLLQRLRGLIVPSDEKSATAVEQATAEKIPEIALPQQPAIAVSAEKAVIEVTVADAEEQRRTAAENAALEKLATEKAELERQATDKAEQFRVAGEKAAEEKNAAEKAERELLAIRKNLQERITAAKAIEERMAAEKAELERLASEKARQMRVAEEKTAAEKAERQRMAVEKAQNKPEPVRTLTSSAPAPAAQRMTDSRQPSSWNSLLAMVGLHDDRHSIPPQELKDTPLQPGQDYIIGPGDVIGVSVWRDEALTRSAVVLPDGKIQFPLIGEVVAGGKTVLQLKQEFVDKLSKYVVDADISVDVKQSNSLVIYIIGKVNNPGRQMLLSNTTVLQALSMAGGLNLFADKDDIKIFRQDNDRTVVYSFRYSKVVSGTNLADNITLKRGDVIVVP